MNKVLFGLLGLVMLVCSTSTVAAESSDVIVTVDSSSLRFSPSQVTITEGQALAHNAVADDGMFDSGDPERDVDYRFVFEVGTAGSYTFVCEPHASAGMVGTITVDAAPVEVVEEEEEPELPAENTPALSLVSSLMVMAFATTLVARNGKLEDMN